MSRTVVAFGREQSLAEWSREFGLKRNLLEQRLRLGWDAEEALTTGVSGAAHELWRGANDLPWEADLMAQAVVAEFGELTLEQVGACLGVTRERARQIEEMALKRFIRGLELEGLIEQMRAWLLERIAMADAREPDRSIGDGP